MCLYCQPSSEMWYFEHFGEDPFFGMAHTKYVVAGIGREPRWRILLLKVLCVQRLFMTRGGSKPTCLLPYIHTPTKCLCMTLHQFHPQHHHILAGYQAGTQQTYMTWWFLEKGIHTLQYTPPRKCEKKQQALSSKLESKWMHWWLHIQKFY